MERIVLGISAINFNQTNNYSIEDSYEDCDLLENCPPNSPEQLNFLQYHLSGIQMNTMSEDCAAATQIFSEETSSENTTDTISSRRSLPRRASKDHSILKLSRRSIMKPKRITQTISQSAFKNRLGDIKKIYLQTNKLKSFRPSNLETIFEEPRNDTRLGFQVIGAKKLKRSLSCSDGLNHTKALIKSRRMRIKKIFGRRKTFKKLSLNDFIERLKANLTDQSDCEIRLLHTESTLNVTEEPDVCDITVNSETDECTPQNFLIDHENGFLVKSNSFSGAANCTNILLEKPSSFIV